MRVLVTGGAGFIGSHLCDALHHRGDEVWCVDNLFLGQEKFIEPLQSHKNFHFHKVDVLDRKKMADLFRQAKFDGVYHLAANSDIQRGGVDRNLDLKLNFQTTFEILELMAHHQVKQLFFASTSAVFGETSARLNETYGPLKPESFYGASKLAAEAYSSVYAKNNGIRTVVLRFPNVVGPRLTHGAVHDFIAKLKKDPRRLTVLGDGHQCKPYLHVEDLIQAILLVMDRSAEIWSLYHVGNEDRTTVKEMVQIVLEEMKISGCAVEYTGGERGWVGDVPQFEYDMTKIQKLGWKQHHGSNDAIRLAVRQILELEKT